MNDPRFSPSLFLAAGPLHPRNSINLEYGNYGPPVTDFVAIQFSSGRDNWSVHATRVGFFSFLPEGD